MKQIDTKQWKEFVIKDLFTVKRPSARSQANYEDGDVPFVASGNFNNGVLKYLQPKENEILDSGNCITVSPIDGSSFYQEDDFLGRGGAGSSIILLYNPNLNPYNGYFIATVIRTVCRKYAYSDMANKDTIGSEKIKLPVDEIGNPDFLYMESYMKNLELAVSSSLTDLQSAKKFGVSGEIDISNWKMFEISDLFTVQKGKRLTKADMKEGKIRFIGASAINNGITAYISNDEHLHPQNTITLSYNGSIGEAFYQDEIFWASDDVNVLYPKFEINREIAFFIIPLLKTAGKRYAFIDKWKKEDMEKSKIPLPADIDGNPDYKCMEKYIAIELRITENTLNKLTACV
ncbi:MAG: restriction endonuclease subunit S [Clostridia bacterium]|nr:restriction endonuclease subunit S [Clostridia bacterium]